MAEDPSPRPAGTPEVFQTFLARAGATTPLETDFSGSSARAAAVWGFAVLDDLHQSPPPPPVHV